MPGMIPLQDRLAGHPVDDVVLARVLGDFQPDLVAADGFLDRFVLDLHGVDALAEIAGVAEDADRLPDGKGYFQLHRRHGQVTVVVRHHPDPDLAGPQTARWSFD